MRRFDWAVRPRLAALVCAASLAACSSPTGLVATGDPGAVCVPASADGEATVGLDTLQSNSGGPVEVISASLVDPSGLTLVGWSLVEPGSERAKVDIGYDAPTADDRATVVPTGAGMVLVLGLHFDEAPGTAKGVTVSFTEDGHKGTTRTVNGLKMVPAGQVCG